MSKITMDNAATINESYEFLQIIKDFGNALEIFREAFQNSYDNDADTIICKVYIEESFGSKDLIIDIIDNGFGLEKSKISNFFNLADSTKITENLSKINNKLGYKGHGSKIFFNSQRVIIASKSLMDETNSTWGVVCDKPLEQLKVDKRLGYSGILNLSDLNITFPDECKNSGFFLRIVNPEYFNTKSTWYKLDHSSLRDYIKWFTVFGSIKPILENKLGKTPYNTKLYLKGLDFGDFRREYEFKPNIEPKPEFVDLGYEKMELIRLGHYFPSECSDSKVLKVTATNANEGKNMTDYYSHMINSIKNPISSENSDKFSLIINLEGYETKRKYNLCLNSNARGNRANDKIHYTDDTRYGLWACKDGIPIEHIDDWIEGGKGTYSYMHAFLDCDSFELTANRGSIRNTNNEVLDSVKSKLNEILDSQSVRNELKDREDEIRREKRKNRAEEDKSDLQKRYRKVNTRHKIIFPDGTELLAPSKNNKKDYSESETMVLLIQLIDKFPNLFDFNILDYNTVEGIDFLVVHKNSPKYIELKGSLKSNINHSFEVVSKFICYTISTEISNGRKVSDSEGNIAVFKTYKKDKFHSNIVQYNGIDFTGYKIEPETSSLDSIEVIALDKVLTEVLGAKIQ